MRFHLLVMVVVRVSAASRTAGWGHPLLSAAVRVESTLLVLGLPGSSSRPSSAASTLRIISHVAVGRSSSDALSFERAGGHGGGGSAAERGSSNTTNAAPDAREDSSKFVLDARFTGRSDDLGLGALYRLGKGGGSSAAFAIITHA